MTSRRRTKKGDAEHYMATMVMFSKSTKLIGTDEHQISEVVDGQQRVTTLILLLKAIEKMPRPNGYCCHRARTEPWQPAHGHARLLAIASAMVVRERSIRRRDDRKAACRERCIERDPQSNLNPPLRARQSLVDSRWRGAARGSFLPRNRVRAMAGFGPSLKPRPPAVASGYWGPAG
jgi:hypothetical protein